MAGNSAATNTTNLTSRSPENTQRLGGIIGELAQPGDVLLLTGNLGAGKTCLTQGIAAGLGCKDHAQSPSFVIMRELTGRLLLYHIDLYRLGNSEEIADLGLDDYFYGQGLSVVEWAERAFHLLPPQHLLIDIQYYRGYKRNITLTASGRHYQQMAEEIKKRYGVKYKCTLP